MKKKVIAIILEIIPIVSAIVSAVFILIPYGSDKLSVIIPLITLVAFLGFVFFFIAKKLCKKSKLVKVLGILDWISTLYVIVLYIIAIFSFGL